jgi:hypothetical protein
VHIKNELEGSSHKLKIKGYLFPLRKEARDIKFTSFFKQVSLKFSNENYNNFTVRNGLRQWKKPQPGGQEKDGIVLKFNCL